MTSPLNWRRSQRIEPTPKPVFKRFIQAVVATLVILALAYIMLVI